MARYIAQAQDVNLNAPILFDASIPCSKGYIFHENQSGNFYLRGVTPNGFARYDVTVQGNIAIPTGGTVTPIAISIVVDGEERPYSRSIVTPAAVDTYGNFVAKDLITVPKGMNFSVSAEYVSGVTDGTTVPTPTVNVINTSMDINRIA